MASGLSLFLSSPLKSPLLFFRGLSVASSVVVGLLRHLKLFLQNICQWLTTFSTQLTSPNIPSQVHLQFNLKILGLEIRFWIQENGRREKRRIGRERRTDGLFAIELGSGQLISAGSSVIVFLILLSWSAFAKLCAGLLKSQLSCQFFVKWKLSSSNFACLSRALLWP